MLEQQQERQQPRPRADTAGSGYVRVLGLAAGMFALLQALIAASAAQAAQSSVLAYQRSLITDYGGGGVSIDPLLGPLLKLFIITYVTDLLAFAVTLGFAWYAGRIVAMMRGSSAGGGRAGTTVTAISSVVWLAVTLLAALLFHSDGTIGWLIATLALTPSGAQSGLLVTAPNSAFVGIQAAVLLVQAFIGISTALAFGTLAGRIGAEGRPRSRTASAPA